MQNQREILLGHIFNRFHNASGFLWFFSLLILIALIQLLQPEQKVKDNK